MESRTSGSLHTVRSRSLYCRLSHRMSQSTDTAATPHADYGHWYLTLDMASTFNYRDIHRNPQNELPSELTLNWRGWLGAFGGLSTSPTAVIEAWMHGRSATILPHSQWITYDSVLTSIALTLQSFWLDIAVAMVAERSIEQRCRRCSHELEKCTVARRALRIATRSYCSARDFTF